MNNVYFPVQIAALVRRLFNVISTLSLTNQYLLSRTQADDSSPQSLQRPSSLFTQPDTGWNWLISVYKFQWSDFVNPVDFASSSLTDTPARGSQCPLPGFESSTRFDTKYATLSDSASSTVTSSTSPLERSISPDSERNSNKHPPQFPQDISESQDTIHRLMNNPTLLNPVRAPRYPIVLCHGLYGFDVRGPAAFPSLRLHYWSNVLSILKKKLGADVIVTTVPGTGSVASRAENLDRLLQEKARGRGINLIAHSMGGLDCRHLITHLRPTEYVPLSLTSISTPHRGSPFMDWCAQYLGLGRRQHEFTNKPPKNAHQQAKPPSEISSTESHGESEKREAFSLSLSSLPSSFTTLLLSVLDSPAYANLTTSYLNDVFNPATPDDPCVKYFSVVSRTDDMNIWHPLWLPKMVLDDAEKRAQERLKLAAGNKSYNSGVPPWEQEDKWGNDGLVTVQSARWGEFLGILEGCDHWEIRGARGMEFNIDLPSVPLGSITNRVGGGGWALGDWSRFIGTWKRQEKHSSGELKLAPSTNQSTKSGSSTVEERDQIRWGGHNDPVVKASTEKLSAVFDWMIDQVPTPANTLSPKDKVQTKTPVKSDLATRLDLERFYIALTRKLYDEGL
ncbi:alpha/beta-hydrolase [Gyrodon lividus]|nr:alpha/beta-hydrolase [Gyrodon lividus]